MYSTIGPALHVADEALFVDPLHQALDGKLMDYSLRRELQALGTVAHSTPRYRGGSGAVGDVAPRPSSSASMSGQRRPRLA